MNHYCRPSESHHNFGASAGLEVAGMHGFTHLQADAYSWGGHQHFRPMPPMHHRPTPPCLPHVGFDNGYNQHPYNNFNQNPYNNFSQNPYNNFNNANPYNNFNQFNPNNNFQGGDPYINQFNPNSNFQGGDPYINQYPNEAPPSSFPIQQSQIGAYGYNDGVNVGTSSFSGNPNEGAAAWGTSGPNGGAIGGIGWGRDAYGRTVGGGSITFVAPDGSLGRGVLHSANGQGELDWRSSTGSGVIKWGPGYYNSYTVPVNPYAPQRQCW